MFLSFAENSYLFCTTDYITLLTQMIKMLKAKVQCKTLRKPFTVLWKLNVIFKTFA